MLSESRSISQPSVHMKINQVCYRYLGLNLENLFSWQHHVDYLCSRLQQRLHVLCRLRVFGGNQYNGNTSPTFSPVDPLTL